MQTVTRFTHALQREVAAARTTYTCTLAGPRSLATSSVCGASEGRGKDDRHARGVRMSGS